MCMFLPILFSYLFSLEHSFSFKKIFTTGRYHKCFGRVYASVAQHVYDISMKHIYTVYHGPRFALFYDASQRYVLFHVKPLPANKKIMAYHTISFNLLYLPLFNNISWSHSLVKRLTKPCILHLFFLEMRIQILLFHNWIILLSYIYINTHIHKYKDMKIIGS